eukprot:11373042-Heterocapsa_arctica.AAC.1
MPFPAAEWAARALVPRSSRERSPRRPSSPPTASSPGMVGLASAAPTGDYVLRDAADRAGRAGAERLIGSQ